MAGTTNEDNVIARDLRHITVNVEKRLQKMGPQATVAGMRRWLRKHVRGADGPEAVMWEVVDLIESSDLVVLSETGMWENDMVTFLEWMRTDYNMEGTGAPAVQGPGGGRAQELSCFGGGGGMKGRMPNPLKPRGTHSHKIFGYQGGW